MTTNAYLLPSHRRTQDAVVREVRGRAAEVLAAVRAEKDPQSAYFAGLRASEWLRIGSSFACQRCPESNYFTEIIMSSTTDRRLVVPYVTSWTTETDMPFEVVYRRGGGIAYADEIATDRDDLGILWTRTYSRQHDGRPEFGNVHSLRQRRAMRRLLCQVCGKPADQSDEGVLWLLPDHRGDWDGWPDGMGDVEPPICRPCVELSLRLCPKLRRGAAIVRAREYPIAGVRGVRYEPGPTAPIAVESVVVSFDDHAIRWVRAAGLVRQLFGCTLLSAEELCAGQS